VSQDDGAPRPDQTDRWIALVVGVTALGAYVRTLAPDVLYGDSAEFQTLAYTLGMTHSTGYPVYLLLGRLLGFLPVGSPAWRINLLSAVGAAVALGCIFLLVRHLTRSRVGALLGSVALDLSYTFWSQAIIAEVYTPALAFLTAILILLWRWRDDPTENNRLLLFASLLTGLSLGVHLFVALVMPTAVAFVAWTLYARRKTDSNWQRSLVAAAAGLALGVAMFLAAFLLIDVNYPPTSFYQVALVPSRSMWGLAAADLDTPFERLWVTFSGVQWQDAMFPGNLGYMWGELKDYVERLSAVEFSPVALLCALLGLGVALWRVPGLGSFVLMGLVTTLFFILNYEPPDKTIFYLPTYVFVTVAVGAGAGILLEWLDRSRVVAGRRIHLLLYPLGAGLLILAIGWPSGASRWQALRAGAATFVREEYVYPLYNLDEPRKVATRRLEYLPDRAVVILKWRALYTTYYLAHVERGRTDLVIMEASPHPGGGRLASTLVEELEEAMVDGRSVYTEEPYRELRDRFRLQPVPGTDLFQLSLPGAG
jgi:hypothetical protein